MGRLASEGHLVPLDAERSQHDSQRKLERLQHRPLLDVQLEVGRGVLELAPRLERSVQIDVEARDCLRQ